MQGKNKKNWWDSFHYKHVIKQQLWSLITRSDRSKNISSGQLREHSWYFWQLNIIKKLLVINGNMSITTNAVNIIVKPIEDVLICPHHVWYHPKSITNIVDYSHLSNHYQINYYNHKEDVFLLHKNFNKIIRFVGI